MKKLKTFKYFLLFTILFTVPSGALAKSAKYKRGQLADSLKDAVNRSQKDQRLMKVRYNNEADQRIENWSARELETIKITHTGTSSVAPMNFGDPNFSTEELGEDQSGLDSLHSDIVEEPTDIDFDKELREVSSAKN